MNNFASIKLRPADIEGGDPFIGFLIGYDEHRRIFFFGISNIKCSVELDNESFAFLKNGGLIIGDCYKISSPRIGFFKIETMNGALLFDIH